MSAGRNQKYAYYHCNGRCGFWVRADIANSRFLEMLKGLQPSDILVKQLKQLLEAALKSKKEQQLLKCKQISKVIERFKERELRLKSLLLDGCITHRDYQVIRVDIQLKIDLLGEAISNRSNLPPGAINTMANLEVVNLHASFLALNKESKPLLLNLVCKKGWHWREGSMQDMLKPLVKSLFGTDAKEVCDEAPKFISELFKLLS